MKIREKREGEKQVKKAIVSSLIAVFVMSVVIGLVPYDFVQTVSADPGWTKKAPIHIDNTGGGALTYYQVNLNITHTYYMNTNFSDLRVKNDTAGTFMPYWIEDKVDGAWCNLWFNATSIPASAWCNDTYYLYYGDVGASSASNGTNTFLNFEDGETGSFTVNLAGSADAERLAENWKRYSNNPVIPIAGGEWDSAHSGLEPSFIKESGIYEVIFGGVNAGGDYDIGLANGTSLTSLTKSGSNPVLQRGSSGDWDDDQIYPNILMKVDADYTYYLWYSGCDGTNYRIGLACSNNLTTWVKPNLGLITYNGSTDNNIVLDVGTGWETTFVFAADIIKVGSTYYMFYTGYDGTYEKIGKATSSDGKDWTKYGSNPVLTVGSSGEWDDIRLCWPSIEILNDGWYMWFDGWDGVGANFEVGRAKSTDQGDTWTKFPHNPTFVRGVSGQPDDERIDSPFVRSIGGKIEMLYEGRDGTKYQGCYAERLGFMYDFKEEATADGWVIGAMQPNQFKAQIVVNDMIRWGSDTDGGIKVLELADFSSVPSPMANTAYNPQSRVAIVRYGRDKTTTPGEFYVYYVDTGGSYQYWTGSTWGSLTTFGGRGTYTATLTDDGTNFKMDIFDSNGNTIITNEASVTKTSVKSFGDGRALVCGEPLTTHFYVSQMITDYIVRKYASPEPTATLGDEQPAQEQEGDCTTPDILSLTNSTPGTNNVTILWTTDQNADNRVKYSNVSSMNLSWWSYWKNDTTIIEIDITGLDAGTTYYYQAWSYNGTNSSCLATEPEAQPYNNFTTQEEPCTTPVITDLTNSTPGTTNVTITFSSNQSNSNNRVEYSKNSDLSNEEYSNWHNNTGSISIDITGLDSNTPYFYRAWSYNSSDSGCRVYEPTEQPYPNFTTQTSGGGAYNITLLSGSNIIGWTDTTPTTSTGLCTNIGANCTWVYDLSAAGTYTSKHCGYPGGDFDVNRGWGYETLIVGETKWEREA